MKPEEIKKGLECCAAQRDGRCEEYDECACCPYFAANPSDEDILALIQQLEDHIREVTKLVPKWIGVREADPHAECLAVGKYGDMLIGCVYPRGNEYWCENEHEVLYNVTHWMPLPEPPKEG